MHSIVNRLAISATVLVLASGCAAPPQSSEAGFVTALKPHPLESRRPLNAPSIPSAEMPGTAADLTAFLAPENTGRMVGHSFSSNALSNTTAVHLHEAPVLIARGACRQLIHVARASHPPSSQGEPQTDFFGDLITHVGFFAAGADGRCVEDRDGPTFWASTDAEAIEALKVARATLHRVADGTAVPNCAAEEVDCSARFRETFLLDQITQAGRCLHDRDCHAFQVGAYGATVRGGTRARVVELVLAPPPPPE